MFFKAVVSLQYFENLQNLSLFCYGIIWATSTYVYCHLPDIVIISLPGRELISLLSRHFTQFAQNMRPFFLCVDAEILAHNDSLSR